MEQDLLARLALTVDKVVNEELVKTRRNLGASLTSGGGKSKIGASAGYVASLTRVVDEFSLIIAKDLDAFSRHAKRQKVISCADVLLCARKNEDLHRKLREHVGIDDDLLSPSVKEKKKKKENKGVKRKREAIGTGVKGGGEKEEEEEEGYDKNTTRKTDNNDIVDETDNEDNDDGEEEEGEKEASDFDSD
jgi:histone H3/H4